MLQIKYEYMNTKTIKLQNKIKLMYFDNLKNNVTFTMICFQIEMMNAFFAADGTPQLLLYYQEPELEKDAGTV